MASPVLSSDLRRLSAVVCHLSFGFLAAPERFRNERLGEDELGLGHLLDRQQNLVRFPGCRIPLPGEKSAHAAPRHVPGTPDRR